MSEKFNMDNYRELLNSISSNMSQSKLKPIEDSYVKDYNICWIDEMIKNKLQEEERYFLPTLKNRVLLLEMKLKEKEHHLINYNKIVSDIMGNIKMIRDVRSGKRYDDYINLTKDIIFEYANMRAEIRYLTLEQLTSQKETDVRVNRKIYLIENFLAIAKKYIDINVTHTRLENADLCINCGASLKDIVPNENGSIICEVKSCQVEHSTVTSFKPKKDSYKTNAAVGDDSIDNFMKSFFAYQGIVKMTPETQAKLISLLDAYFTSIRKPTGEEVKLLPLNSRGRRGDTTHKMLNMALSKIGKTEHYKHTNYIGHVYWGWALPDVSHLEEVIKRDYIKTQKAYNQIPKEVRERSSSLGTNYRLFRHLQLRGHKCYMDEFKIAANDRSLRIHDNTWRMICELTEDPEIKYIETSGGM